MKLDQFSGGRSIPRLHAHLCRHTFGTNYLRNGGDVFSLQKILGHEDLSTVKMYMHLVEADVAKKHELYSPINRLDLPSPNRRIGSKKRRISYNGSTAYVAEYRIEYGGCIVDACCG